MRRFAILVVVLLCAVFFSSVVFAETIEFSVKKGDNFWTLAKKYNVNHRALIELNKGNLKNQKNPNLIYPGQKFIVKFESIKSKTPVVMVPPEKVKTVKMEAEKAAVRIPIPEKSVVKIPVTTKTRMDKNGQDAPINYVKVYLSLLVLLIFSLSLVALVFLFKRFQNKDKPFLLALRKRNISQKNVVIVDNNKEDEVSRSDNYQDQPERYFVGIDDDKILYCIGDEENQIIGNYDQIAKFSVKMCKEECRKYLILMEDDEFARVFGTRPLDADEKRQLELSISRELELLRA